MTNLSNFNWPDPTENLFLWIAILALFATLIIVIFLLLRSSQGQTQCLIITELASRSGFFIFGGKNPALKIQKIPKTRGSGFIFSRYSGDSGYLRFSGFFSLGIFIPGIRDFLNFETLIPDIGIFFVGWDIPTKSHLCFYNEKFTFSIIVLLTF